MLQLADHWTWDFWFAQEEDTTHVFYLKAPKSLGDPDLRHVNARIGHAVSTDLRNWTELPDALEPGPEGSWDDMSTWTGSVIRAEGTWHLFYTGISHAEKGLEQRIGHAVSDDLITWTKDAANPVLEADGRFYEQLDTDVWPDLSWRDPWVYWNEETGDYRMLLTTRVPTGPLDGRGVIGAARSDDLRMWEALPPVTEPGDFAHLEVPQLVQENGAVYVLFSAYGWANSEQRRRRSPEVTGTHYLVGDSTTGPFRSVTDEFLCGDPRGELYAGRMLRDRSGQLQFFGFVQFPGDEPFVGALSDPIPVDVGADGRLRLRRGTTAGSSR
ncbi:family 43 glycosylhydrolase [Phytoactinopolyspora mesophila]|uniref:family 43 glycosylhydrolase n=1 Tax=Phytoactinopolyspora mesophila TaxID=2650750 RepID=UPI001390CADF